MSTKYLVLLSFLFVSLAACNDTDNKIKEKGERMIAVSYTHLDVYNRQYLLCAVLVGPAMTCLHGITVKTVRDEPCYMWHEFKKCWKGNWKQSVPAGGLCCTLLAMECIAAWYYMFMQSEILSLIHI